MPNNIHCCTYNINLPISELIKLNFADQKVPEITAIQFSLAGSRDLNY
jgi:uncharacterized Fe-S radical SAM superfamily protein PflX